MRHKPAVRGTPSESLGERSGAATVAFVTALLLGYEDIERARDFFTNALGFEDLWEVRDNDGSVTRSHVQLGDTVLMLDKPGAHGVKNPTHVGGVTHLIVITVGDVDAHHARAAKAGATVITPPSDRPWGRDYELQDPEGYIFSFISSITTDVALFHARQQR